jgi:hypothetical protein
MALDAFDGLLAEYSSAVEVTLSGPLGQTGVASI